MKLFTREQFQDWGRAGARTKARLLGKAKRKHATQKKPASKRGRHIGSSKVDPAQAETLYKQGKTLVEIGSQFGVTRERVRQILKKRGMNGDDGGRSVKAFLNIPLQQEKKRAKSDKWEKRTLRIWGITRETYLSIKAEHGATGHKGTPFTRYMSQRRNAKLRKIGWNLTFAQWWNTWQDSGKYHLYGRGQGAYVMSRYGDTGPYDIGNINIVASVENNSETCIKKNGLPIGVRKRGSSFCATKMVNGKSYYIGTFGTAEEAHNAYLAFSPKVQSNGARKKRGR